MSNSYVPEESYVICNNMTNGVPLQLGMSRDETHVVKGEKTPLLNKLDRKISASFECVIPGIYWGGFQALLLGIAVAALVIATVATGGLALAAVIVCAAACIGSIAAGVKGIYEIAHACDITLQSEWDIYHSKVNIEKENALLSCSILMCKKPGFVTIIIDPVVAINVAEKISDHNMNAFYAQLGSQFLMGMVGTFAAACGGWQGLVISSVYAVPMYFWGEEEDFFSDNPWVDNGLKNAIDFAASTLTPALPFAGGALLGAGIYGGGVAFQSVEKQLLGALLNKAMGDKFAQQLTLKKPQNLRGTGAGLAAAIINTIITTISDNYESEQQDSAKQAQLDALKNDKTDSVKIIADSM